MRFAASHRRRRRSPGKVAYNSGDVPEGREHHEANGKLVREAGLRGHSTKGRPRGSAERLTKLNIVMFSREIDHAGVRRNDVALGQSALPLALAA
jgi:hypothetical protein